MNSKQPGPPPNLTSLRARLRNLAAAEVAVVRLERAVANIVLAQMLPAGAVKGGTALKLRLGHSKSRFTPDLDVARRDTMERFLEELERALRDGWAGFRGRIVPIRPAKSAGVPAEYVMQPYDIKMTYRTRSWLTVRLEVGHDEIGDTDHPDWELADDLADTFLALGLPTPSPVPVLPLAHQIAQKLHACSAVGSDRAHDLVDLQLLIPGLGDVESEVLRGVCERLFAARGAQPWPPTVSAQPGWDSIYEAASQGVECRQTLEESVAWVNHVITRIGDARSQG